MEILFVNENKDNIKRVFARVANSKDSPISSSAILSKDEIEKQIVPTKDCKYIFSTWGMPTFSIEEINEYFPVLKAVFYAAGSVKYFAEPFLENGVKVFSASYSNGCAVADFTVGQILLANKGYYQATYKYHFPLHRLAYRSAHHVIDMHPGNYAAVVGLVGFGMVGKRVATLLQQYDVRVLVCDPYVDKLVIEKHGARKVDLQTLMVESDIISNHLPDIQETKGYFNYDVLSRMKPFATFINTGRGAQVVEKDLIRVMREKKNSTALLDVTSHEPLWPWSPLYRCKNIFVTPHMAGSTGLEEQRLGEYIIDAFTKYAYEDNCDLEVDIDTFKHGA